MCLARGISDLIVVSGVWRSVAMASRKPSGSLPRNPVIISRFRLCGSPHLAAFM